MKLCIHCKVPVHKIGNKWEHVLPPYVWCALKIGNKAQG